jgi:serine/threonine protein kinase
MSWLREANAEPIPGYRLIEPLGSGGFGEVWKCEAPGGLFKAIKFVYGNLNSLDVDGVRAEQELHALQRIKEVRHPFVLSLDRIEIVAGELVIVMELADKSLHDAYVECQAAGLIGIPRDDLLRFLRDAAEALDHMNDKHNLQHLDVKPRNLFLISDRVKVADFGLVKHLERQSASGLLGGVTPLYAAPETFNGRISERSDQYSLAIVYQELLTGQRPFHGKNVRQLAQQHLQGEPELRSLPESERPVVARALMKDPAKRFPNCMAFVGALYRAKNQARLEPAIPEAAVTGNGQRPKSMRETMEDILLDHLAGGDASSGNGHSASKTSDVDLGGPPPEEDPVEEVSNLGITIAQPQTGALRPTLILGVGAFGRQALIELRCRFLDRFGDLQKIPLLHFLCVDPDQDAVNRAVRGSPEVAFSRNEVYHLPLQAVAHYRRRMLDQISEWLPREKLYAIPRSLQTQGCRALGRLAFADNHQRFLARLRREIQQITHPDTLYQSVSQTGLALRDSTPRIYIIAAAGGGGSGFLVDLGYGLRRLLQQLRYTDAQVTALLMCGAPDDPATPKQEQANVYATLTELNHFSDPAIPFAAQYGVDGQRIVDPDKPYNSTYLLQLAHRSPEALRDAVAHLGSYLFHELTTPLGLRLDAMRQCAPGAEATPFRSFGTYAVWFPRGLLLRLAARRACKRLIDDWMAPDMPTAQAELEAACARVLADPGLRPEALSARIEEGASAGVQTDFLGTPAEALTGLLASLEEQSQQSVAMDDPGNWARQALGKVRDLVGTGSDLAPETPDWRKSRLHRALAAAAQKVAEEWDKDLAKTLWGLMEHPGRRVAAAEAAIQSLQKFCVESAEAHRRRLEQQAQKTHKAWQQLEEALAGCLSGGGGGWGFQTLFGNRSRRLLRVFMDHLAAFARQRLAEEVVGSAQQFFAILHGRLEDRIRELAFTRQRLRHLQECLESPSIDGEELAVTRFGAETTLSHSPLPSAEAFWETIRQSATAHVVLPQDEDDLERAGMRYLAGLNQEQWTQLDQALQDRVLSQLGGLHHACTSCGDLTRNLAAPLVDQAASCLGEHLPIMDVAEVQFSLAESRKEDIAVQTQACLEKAEPLVSGKDPAAQHALLLIPASEAGKSFGESARKAIADLKVVRVPGQADLMFCREQSYLTIEELQRVLRPCRPAYESLSGVPHSSPHARCDILDWVPLDP